MQHIDEALLLKKLKDAREARGLSGDAVAHQLGKQSNAFISRIENGKQKLTIETLNALCDIYQLKPQALLSSSHTGTPPYTFKQKGFLENLMFRSESNNLPDFSIQAIKQNLPVLRKIGKTMKRLGDAPIALSDFFSKHLAASELSSSAFTRTLGKKIANNLRQYLNLGDDPIADIQRLTWSVLKIPICSIDLGKHCWGIYNTNTLGTPLIIYSSATNTAQRNIFTIAHELGHHFFSPNEPSIDLDNKHDSLMEVFSDAFAQELLVPTDALTTFMREEGLLLIKNMHAKHVVSLCEHFRVSYKMMLFVLKDNNLVTIDQFNQLTNISTSTLDDYHPEQYMPPPISLTRILEHFVIKGVRKHKFSLLFASEMLEMTESEVKALV